MNILLKYQKLFPIYMILTILSYNELSIKYMEKIKLLTRAT